MEADAAWPCQDTGPRTVPDHAPVSPGRPGGRRQVLLLAWPIAVSMMSFTLKGFVDTLMVASLGTSSLGGVGVAQVMSFIALAFPMGVLRGQKALVGQYQGARRHQEAFLYGVQASHVALLFGLLCAGAAFLAAPLFQMLLGGSALEDSAVSVGRDYLRLRLLWAAPYLLTLAIAEYLRATGRPRLPMIADLVAHPLNVFFNWTLIFGHLGVQPRGAAGAAIGTGLADTVSLVVLLVLASAAFRPWPPLRSLCVRAGHALRLLAVGSTLGVQFTLEVGGFTLITYLVGFHLGTVAAAVHQATMQILQLSFLPAIAIGDGGSVLVARFVGQRRPLLARRAARSMLQLILPLMVTAGVCYLVFGRALMGWFLHDADPAREVSAVDLGASVLAVGAAWQLADALQIVYRFSLRAAGDHRWVMVTGVACNWLLAVPAAMIALLVLHGDLTTVWLLWMVELYAGSFLFWRRWVTGRWLHKRMVREDSDRSGGRVVEGGA